MTEGVGFTSFLVSACRVKVAQYTLYGEEDDESTKTKIESNDVGKPKETKNNALFDKPAAEMILRWEYPIVLHPSCQSLLSTIMESIATAHNEPSLRDLKGLEVWDFLLSIGSIKRIAMRTRFIDYYMLKTVQTIQKPIQIVVLGAGMDTRPFRLPFSTPPSHYYELDLPAVMDFKRALFLPPSSPHPPQLSLIGADLTDPSWPSLITSQGFSPSHPTLWVLEGLVMYLPESSVLSLLTSLSSLSSPGSHLMLHTVNLKEVAGTDSSSSDFLSSVSSKMVYGVDDPASLITKLGKWTKVESYDYQKIETLLGCEGYLSDVKTNSLFTTAMFGDTLLL